MAYNYAKLSGRIVEKCETQAKFAEAMGLSERSISMKLNSKVGWKQNEILDACRILSISHAEIHKYFFASKVQD